MGRIWTFTNLLIAIFHIAFMLSWLVCHIYYECVGFHRTPQEINTDCCHLSDMISLTIILFRLLTISIRQCGSLDQNACQCYDGVVDLEWEITHSPFIEHTHTRLFSTNVSPSIRNHTTESSTMLYLLTGPCDPLISHQLTT